MQYLANLRFSFHTVHYNVVMLKFTFLSFSVIFHIYITIVFLYFHIIYTVIKVINIKGRYLSLPIMNLENLANNRLIG